MRAVITTPVALVERGSRENSCARTTSALRQTASPGFWKSNQGDAVWEASPWLGGQWLSRTRMVVVCHDITFTGRPSWGCHDAGRIPRQRGGGALSVGAWACDSPCVSCICFLRGVMLSGILAINAGR